MIVVSPHHHHHGRRPSSAVMLFAVYALCMFALYSFMPVVVRMTSATAVNLSLLTADLFSLFCGLFLFHYKVVQSAKNDFFYPK